MHTVTYHSSTRLGSPSAPDHMHSSRHTMLLLHLLYQVNLHTVALQVDAKPVLCSSLSLKSTVSARHIIASIPGLSFKYA